MNELIKDLKNNGAYGVDIVFGEYDYEITVWVKTETCRDGYVNTNKDLRIALKNALIDLKDLNEESHVTSFSL